VVSGSDLFKFVTRKKYRLHALTICVKPGWSFKLAPACQLRDSLLTENTLRLRVRRGQRLDLRAFPPSHSLATGVRVRHQRARLGPLATGLSGTVTGRSLPQFHTGTKLLTAIAAAGSETGEVPSPAECRFTWGPRRILRDRDPY
jgi:hypothetical protein